MTPTIAFVGAGPTTIYALHAFVEQATQPSVVTIFEAQATAGRGTPYRPGWNDPAMLSNIASIEIPRLAETLVEWLHHQPSERLHALGVDPAEIGDRAFYPRLTLGAFFVDQFAVVVERARARGIVVDVRVRSRVIDIANEDGGMRLFIRADGRTQDQLFDHVVLATGHQWPAEPEVRPGYFLSPWPASKLDTIPPVRVGIRGSSLTAIDAAVALAVRFGAFVENEAADLGYQPADGTDAFRMTMVSRKGLLPEADFFHPIPYEPLSICTPEAIEHLIATPGGDLLDRAFELFRRELTLVDPAYAEHIGLAGLKLEDFCGHYFADRADADPFVWAQANLREAQRNQASETTVPWRYAILRMHEVIALLVPHLDEDDFLRFTQSFKPIFVDDYATVPHESIRRMLALHRAGKLDIVAIGDDYRIDSHRPQGGAELRFDDQRLEFPVFIEATGQRPLAAKDFPFPTLRTQGIVQDAGATADAATASRGIVIDDQFHPVSDALPRDRLFCLSLPYILGRHPFIQGITSSHEIGEVVGAELAAAIARETAAIDHKSRKAAS